MFRKKQHLTLIAFVLLMIVLVTSTAGCAALDKLQAWKQGGETEFTEEQPVGPESTEDIGDVFAGETREIVLYFSDQEGESLASETRTIPQVEGVARATMQELIAGPGLESGLLPTIPLGTILDDINVRPDGVCIVDFSSELVLNHPGGSLNEELTVYSIVNTLTQFPTIQEVQILVDGQKVESIAGHLDVSTTMARNEEIIWER